ncbi:hypothetical protein FHU30_002653 [Actinomadura rupiterrae]|nr:hypothetical protein [Actinomadura rupiterrae]
MPDLDGHVRIWRPENRIAAARASSDTAYAGFDRLGPD